MLFNLCVYFATFTLLMTGYIIYNYVDRWMMEEVEDCN